MTNSKFYDILRKKHAILTERQKTEVFVMETNVSTKSNDISSAESVQSPQPTKFCKFCGGRIPIDAVLCTLCGRQVEEMHGAAAAQPQVVINNANTNTNTNMVGGIGMRAKNKWTAFLLCLLLGYFGAHKFYEGKAGMGILYIFTVGLFGIGWLIDCIILLTKPNPYYI